MKFSSTRDIEAPLEFTWEQFTDTTRLEQLAAARNAELVRLDALGGLQPGMTWRLSFSFRGKLRQMTVRLVQVVPLEQLHFSFEGETVQGTITLQLAAISGGRTRLTLQTDLKPRTLTARVMIQSLRLARRRADRKYEGGVARIAAMVEERLRKSRA